MSQKLPTTKIILTPEQEQERIDIANDVSAALASPGVAAVLRQIEKDLFEEFRHAKQNMAGDVWARASGFQEILDRFKAAIEDGKAAQLMRDSREAREARSGGHNAQS